MAICMTFDLLSGTTQQQYDAVLKELGVSLGASPPPHPGLLMHIAGPYEGGWRVIEVWESQADLDRFHQEELHEALQKAGISLSGKPQRFDVYNIEK
jgi:hypothetical protein